MAITQSDRTIGIMAHLRPETKERFRQASAIRGKSMSAQLSEVVEQWLEDQEGKVLGEVRSNKRIPIPTIPGHRHTLDEEGNLTCGCVYEDGQMDVALPLESE